MDKWIGRIDRARLALSGAIIGSAIAGLLAPEARDFGALIGAIFVAAAVDSQIAKCQKSL